MTQYMLPISVILIILVSSSDASQSQKKLEAAESVKMNPKQLEKIQQMHYGWYIQAVSSILGSVGKEMYMKMKRDERRAFVACLDEIEKEYDVRSGAKCLVKAFDGKLAKEFPSAAMDRKLDFIDKQDSIPMTRINIKKLRKKKMKKNITKQMARTKVKKILKTIQKQKLGKARFRQLMKRKIAGQFKMTRHMIEKMEKINNRRIRRSVLSLYSNKETAEEAKRVEESDRGPYRPKNLQNIPALLDTKKSAVRVITDAIRQFIPTNYTKNMENSYKSLKKLQDVVSEAKEKNEFKNRMLDMVIGKNHPLRRKKTFSDRFKDLTPNGLVDERVFGLVDSVSKHTDDINANFLSPRILPIMPDKFRSKKRILSPDMFPLYKDDTGNSVLPLPEVLESSGLKESDRESVLELVMDVSGVNTVVDDAFNLIQGLRKTGLDKDIFDVTDLVNDAYNTLSNSLTKSQNLNMANKKFSFMNLQQMDMLYGEKGIYNTTVTGIPFDPKQVDQLTEDEKEESIRLTIRELAKGYGRRRQKRQTITLLGGLYKIVFLNPTVFSPAGFAPTINTLSVLGPLVISPQLFCPSILSPLLISPPVISPQVGNPLIFSPYVVGPNVLSAAVFNAYVFSPYVLSPNVINPYVLSPLILSPFVLCPDVLSPTVLSGVVLSPSVLSPSVFTDSALAANVLSPSFLS